MRVRVNERSGWCGREGALVPLGVFEHLARASLDGEVGTFLFRVDELEPLDEEAVEYLTPMIAACVQHRLVLP